MPALVAGIHVFLFVRDVDGRDKCPAMTTEVVPSLLHAVL
jgi:hypothetical protein